MGWGHWTRRRSLRRLQGPCACSPLLGRSQCGTRLRSSAVQGRVSKGLCVWWFLPAGSIIPAGPGCEVPLPTVHCSAEVCVDRTAELSHTGLGGQGLCIWPRLSAKQKGPDCSSKYTAYLLCSHTVFEQHHWPPAGSCSQVESLAQEGPEGSMERWTLFSDNGPVLSAPEQPVEPSGKPCLAPKEHRPLCCLYETGWLHSS